MYYTTVVCAASQVPCRGCGRLRAIVAAGSWRACEAYGARENALLGQVQKSLVFTVWSPRWPVLSCVIVTLYTVFAFLVLPI